MRTDHMLAPPVPQGHDAADRVLAPLVRDCYEADLRARIDDAVDRQLAVFFAVQSVPSRTLRPAA